MLIYRNTIDPETKASPSLIIFNRPELNPFLTHSEDITLIKNGKKQWKTGLKQPALTEKSNTEATKKC